MIHLRRPSVEVCFDRLRILYYFYPDQERKESNHDSVFSQLINGLSLGSIYALIALGYSMVYGIILLLNFAHGDVIMVGAYMSWFVMNQLGLGPVTAVCATIVTCTLLGVVIEKVAYTPLRGAPRISLLITAIGVSFSWSTPRN